jgi:predicted enzyme related to lactoylglutathione lyase
MSRADFWAYAGQAALKASVSVTDGVEESDLNISFQTGRVDCDSAPYTDDDVELPGPNMDYEELISFYAERFGMDEEQAVAIMGAHTLGAADTDNSGYRGAWVTGGAREFNNDYYTIMLSDDASWTQRNINSDDESDPKWQWNAPNVGFMLNSDMCLIKEIEMDENGESACTYDTCASSSGLSYFQKFADSQSDWLAKFSEAWTIMQSAGDYTLEDVSR